MNAPIKIAPANSPIIIKEMASMKAIVPPILYFSKKIFAPMPDHDPLLRRSPERGNHILQLRDLIDHFIVRTHKKFHEEAIRHIQTIRQLVAAHEHVTHFLPDLRLDHGDHMFHLRATYMIRDDNEIHFAALVVQKDAAHQNKFSDASCRDFSQRLALRVSARFYKKPFELHMVGKIIVCAIIFFSLPPTPLNEFDLGQHLKFTAHVVNTDHIFFSKIMRQKILIGIEKKKTKETRARTRSKQEIKNFRHKISQRYYPYNIDPPPPPPAGEKKHSLSFYTSQTKNKKLLPP